ncbi:MAG: hypothetical protein JXA57_12065 [Armatimonadetes bacterium]|nr:hypothetical protein [Armatimonadota bacterium]
MSKKRMKAKEIASRITGLSCPIFGVSWNPPESQRKIVRDLVTFLEDRRALYQPYFMEHGPWVEQSVLEIRGALTEALQRSPEEDNLIQPLRAMRAACRKFLDTVTGHGIFPRGHYHHEALNWSALGELRGVFGLHLARLCVSFGIDVEAELASTFPSEDSEEKGEADAS